MKFTCPQCGIDKEIRPSLVARLRYCSMRCRTLAAQRGIRPKPAYSEQELRRRSEDQKGSGNSNWRGAAAKTTAKRARAQRAFPLGDCERCGARAVDRHHIDGDVGNNSSENIATLCRRCHMREDGRLAKFGYEIGTNRGPKTTQADQRS